MTPFLLLLLSSCLSIEAIMRVPLKKTTVRRKRISPIENLAVDDLRGVFIPELWEPGYWNDPYGYLPEFGNNPYYGYNMENGNSPHGSSETLHNDWDVEYSAQIQIGHPAQNFIVTLDTGSSNLWVPCVKCLGTAKFCQTHSKFNYNESSTCIWEHGAPRLIPYGSEEVIGFLYSDFVCIDTNPNHCFRQEFVCAQLIYDRDETTADGILGMAWPSLSVDNITTPLEHLFANKMACPQAVFAFWLNRNPSESAEGGELTLCGTDPSRYQGPIAWVPLIFEKFWAVELVSIVIGAEFGWPHVIMERAVAAIDSGTAHIVGPPYYIQKILDLIGAEESKGIDCNLVSNNPTITFSFNGCEITLGGRQYFVERPDGRCYPAFQKTPFTSGSDAELWILGDAFIGNFYTIFDYANKSVGFAYLA